MKFEIVSIVQRTGFELLMHSLKKKHISNIQKKVIQNYDLKQIFKFVKFEIQIFIYLFYYIVLMVFLHGYDYHYSYDLYDV